LRYRRKFWCRIVLKLSSLLSEIQSCIGLREPCAVAEEWGRPTRHPLNDISIRRNHYKKGFCSLEMFYYKNVAVSNIEVREHRVSRTSSFTNIEFHEHRGSRISSFTNIVVHEHRNFIVLLRCLTQRCVAFGSTKTSRLKRGL